jgi:hypothetical protein
MGYYNAPCLISMKTVRHCYDNPMLNSDWNIENVLKVNKYDVVTKDAYSRLNELGECEKDSFDEDAKKETMMILEYMEPFVNDDKVTVIYDIWY